MLRGLEQFFPFWSYGSLAAQATTTTGAASLTASSWAASPCCFPNNATHSNLWLAARCSVQAFRRSTRSFTSWYVLDVGWQGAWSVSEGPAPAAAAAAA